MADQPGQPFSLSAALRTQMGAQLTDLYGPERGAESFRRLQHLLEQHVGRRAVAAAPHRPALSEHISQTDAVLTTYGDQVRAPEVAPLHSLATMLERYFAGLISTVHLLPCSPATDEDGFAVVDHTQVDPALGTWDDVAAVGQHFRLMFDVVLSRVAVGSAWFQGFLRGEAPYNDYFIVADPATDLSQVAHPDERPLLTPFETATGTQYVWTSFGPDQADLNYANPDLLLAMIERLLVYVERGATILRLTDIAFLWKEPGTPCIHLPQSHRILQLVRSVLDAVASEVLLLVDTPGSFTERSSYTGNGTNEAQLIAQSALAPLVLQSFADGNAQPLTEWATELEPATEGTTCLNFLDTPDGIDIAAAEELLSTETIESLAARTLAHGGHVTYRTNPDGTQRISTLNITCFDAFSNPHMVESPTISMTRFMTAQAMMLALAGVPEIYIQSLVGSHNDHAGVAATGHYRSINQQKWAQETLEGWLNDAGSHPAQVLDRYARLLRARAGEPAFHPLAPQVVIAGNPALFTLVRGEIGSQVLCIHNVSASTQPLEVPAAIWGDATVLRDLISGETIEHPAGATEPLRLEVQPYQTLWLRAV
jgi:sucrose phosphorylase